MLLIRCDNVQYIIDQTNIGIIIWLQAILSSPPTLQADKHK